MEKKSRFKLERAGASPSTEARPPAPAWAAPVIIILGIGFILTSLIQMGTLADYGYYRKLFQDCPGILIDLWYPVSWGTHLLGVAVGIGLLSRKEFFRKAGVFLLCIAIVETFWKHSHGGFVQYINLLSEEMAAQGASFGPESVIHYVQAWNVSWFTESSLAWICIAVLMAWEISIALGVIFFLTRPSVKALFR